MGLDISIKNYVKRMGEDSNSIWPASGAAEAKKHAAQTAWKREGGGIFLPPHWKMYAKMFWQQMKWKSN